MANSISKKSTSHVADKDAQARICGRRPLFRRYGLLLCLITALGVAVRAYHLSSKSFWFDEAFSWRLIQFPFFEMLARTAQDNHPPLYFILLKAWAALFGTSEFALRGFSVLCGGVTVVAMYAFMREAFVRREPLDGTPPDANGKEPSLLVAGLVALSAFQIYWSREVRMYTLGTALAALSSWALFWALKAPTQSLKRWTVCGLLALSFAYTHYYALFSLAAEAVFVCAYLLFRTRSCCGSPVSSKHFWCPAFAGAIVLAGWLPWAPFFLRQKTQVQADFWTRPVGLWDLPKVCLQMFVSPEEIGYSRNEALLAASLVAVVLLILLWRGRSCEWYVFCSAAFPFALSVFLSFLGVQVFHFRYFLFAHLFLLAALVIVIWRLPHRGGRALIIALVLVDFLLAFGNFGEWLYVPQEFGARGVVSLIESRRRTDDPVIVSAPSLYLPILYHATERSGWYLYSAPSGIRHHHGRAVITFADLIDDKRLKVIVARRVWTVDSAEFRRIPVPTTWCLKGSFRVPGVPGEQGEILVREFESNAGSQE
jgi:uncharacterized membrane protein